MFSDPIYKHQDHNRQEIRNSSIEKLGSHPTGADLYNGRMWELTTDNRIYFYNGTAIQKIAVAEDLNKFGSQIGGFDASGGAVPDGTTAGQIGSGVNSEGNSLASPNNIQAGDTWVITVDGTITGIAGSDSLSIGDLLMSLVDGPSTAADWVGINMNVIDDDGVGDIFFVGPSGDDNTAVKGSTVKTWATLTAAKNAAIADPSSDTLIYVFPGSYQEVGLAYQNGKYFFSPGAFVETGLVTHADRDQNIMFRAYATYTDNITRFDVYGEGDFFAHQSTDAVDTGGQIWAIQEPTFEGSFSFNTCVGEQDSCVVILDATRCNVKGRLAETQGGSYTLNVRGASQCEFDIDRVIAGGANAMFVRQYTSPFTGKLRFKCQSMTVTSAASALAFQQVDSGAQIVCDVQHLELTDAGSFGINSTQQSGGEIVVNIGRLKTSGVAVLGNACTTNGELFVHVDNIEADKSIYRSISCSNSFKVTLSCIKATSADATTGFILAEGNTANQVKLLKGTYETTDAGASTIDMSSSNTSSTLIVEDVTLISAGTNSITNSQSTAKLIKVNGSLRTNKSFESGKILNSISGSTIIVDTNITE